MMISFLSAKVKNGAFVVMGVVSAAGLVFLRLNMNGLPPVPSPSPARPDPARLMAHVEALAVEPRPIGSAAHERARRYIIDSLRSAKATPIEQQATAVSPVAPGLTRAARVNNVIARLPGKHGENAVLLVAHYDSVPEGPGASDDASAVAGLLEAVRLLAAAGPLRNDVVFLFSDGEEIGMLGAEAFVDSSPFMAHVRAVFNFEARGTTGPVILFETGPESGAFVRAFLSASPYPQGTSLASTIYGLLPHNTDFTVFRNRGLPGLNFACIENLPAYHTRLDNPQNLDQRTLVLLAEHIYTCALTFGNAELFARKEDEAVFFPIIGNIHVWYTSSSAIVSAAATAAFLLLVCMVGIRAGAMSAKESFIACGAAALFIIAAGGIAWACDFMLTVLHPENRSLAEWYNAAWYRIALGLLPLFPAFFFRRLGRRLSPVHVFSGTCLLFALLLILTAVMLPGASYLFQWPLCFAVPLLLIILCGLKKSIPPGIAVVATPILCAPAIMLAAHTFSLGAEALSLPFAWTFVPFLALYLLIIWPFFTLLHERGGRLFPLLVGACFTAALAGGVMTSGFSPAHPLPETIAYGLDTDKDEAVWISCPDQPLAWGKRFFGEDSSIGPLPEFFPLAKGCFNQPRGFLYAPAPPLGLPPPLLRLCSEDAAADGRTITLLLRSQRGAREAVLFIERLPGIGGVMIDGKKIGEMRIEHMKPIYRQIMSGLDYQRWMMIDFSALPAQGVEVRLAAVPYRPLVITVIDICDGLPEAALAPFLPRRADSMPGRSLFVPNGTVAAKKYCFTPSKRGVRKY